MFMGKWVTEASVWRFTAVVVHIVAVYALYLVLSTSLKMGHDMRGLLIDLSLLVTGISFNYSLNLWSLSASRYRISIVVGLSIVFLSLCFYRDVALSISLAVSGVLPTLSALTTLIVHIKTVGIDIRLIKVPLVLIVVISLFILVFTLYRPRLPVFIGREAVLPTGEVAKVEDMLKAYVEQGYRGILITDYGNIPVKNIEQRGEEVILDTQRGVINIAQQFLEVLKKVGEVIKRYNPKIDVEDVGVSPLEAILAKVYPYVKPMVNTFTRISLHILRFIYGLLLIVIAMVVEK
ncbi:MAG: hypothetical protein QW836_09600 [Ignisphaera sp.]|uniref:DUF2070 family protein n=1 Tax=Ignisphaera aggregans TaxID=334771 RepID=A0A7J3JS26_9CREN